MIFKQVFTIPVRWTSIEPIIPDQPEKGRGLVERWTYHQVEVKIKVSDIARSLGARAVRSKGGRSRGLNGMVSVNHLGQVEKPPDGASSPGQS